MFYANYLTPIYIVVLIATIPSTTLAQPKPLHNASKAGLAWPNGDSLDISQYLSTGKVSWYYTWSSFPITTDLEFAPMLWGTKDIEQFPASVQKAKSEHNVTAVLGMNEPEQPGQSNLTAEEGVQLWKTYLEPLHGQGVRLGSPAPSSSPTGKVWLQDFLNACMGGCSVDFIAMHWYGTNATEFINYVTDFHNTFQRPIWVTEWACQNYVDLEAQCSSDDIIKFLTATQTFMDSTDFVERYAWLGAMKDLQGVNPSDALMDGSGKINDLGKQYIGAERPLVNGSGTGGTGGVSVNCGSDIDDGWKVLLLCLVIPAISLFVD